MADLQVMGAHSGKPRHHLAKASMTHHDIPLHSIRTFHFVHGHCQIHITHTKLKAGFRSDWKIDRAPDFDGALPLPDICSGSRVVHSQQDVDRLSSHLRGLINAVCIGDDRTGKTIH